MNRCILLLLFSTGCSGLLVIPEPKAPAIPCSTSAQCGVGLVCDRTAGACVISPGGCSRAQVDGDCPAGMLCAGGACLCADASVCNCPTTGCAGPDTTWCNCQADQGCDAQGQCVPITTDTKCSPTLPDGLCDNGEICVGGRCVPNTNPCSDQNLNGWCDAGLSCVSGRCVRTDSSPCSHENPNGLCPAGEQCIDPPGQCQVVGCAPGVLGACPADEVCRQGCSESPCCEQVACSPSHLGGTCQNGQVCGKCGSCLDPGTCCSDLDCGPNQYCGTTSVCSNLGSCVVDDDCEVKQPPPNFGQGYECHAGGCIERLTCTIASDCLPAKYCSSHDNCLLFPACDGGSDCPTNTNPPQVCSTGGACIDSGTCLVNLDCSDGKVCSHNHTCIPPDTCADDLDCPPARTCIAPTCVLSGTATPCSTNAITTSGCAADQASCCDSANQSDCCPQDAHEICSLQPGANVCIPMMSCVTAADCPPGHFDCTAYACVSNVPCPTGTECAPGELCSTVTRAGCITSPHCAGNSDCALGERCNASWMCEPAPECGLSILSSGSQVPPNILVALDRSASMQICGAGDSRSGCCGYCPGACTSPGNLPYQRPTCVPGVISCTGGVASCTNGTPACTAAGSLSCVGTTPTCTAGSPTCTGGTVGCSQGEGGETVSRWQQAVTAVKQVITDQAGNANFGITIFPATPAVTCTTTGTPTCPGTPQCTNAGTLSCVGTAPTYTPSCTAGSPVCIESCALSCNWYSCSDTVSNGAGVIEVPVGPASGAAIGSKLDVTVPGGGTPTAQTLRGIQGGLAAAGLANPATHNAVLLVTDGEAIGDVAPVQQRVCKPPCSDLSKDGDETDIDCGGSCGPCASGKHCSTADDCASQICRAGVCRPTTCSDGHRNGDETDIDCGGSCGPCSDGATCSASTDCGSLRCPGGTCVTSTCTDNVKNGGETDIDCGGTCGKCSVSKGCLVNADCVSNACQAGICRRAECNDGTINYNETDSVGGATGECGGADCGPCPDGKTCNGVGDCQSGDCSGSPGTCVRPQCNDGIKNGTETDVDCGGGGCPACRGGKVCTASGDCLSNSCGLCDTSCASPNCPTCSTNCGTAACKLCLSGQEACKVNYALDELYASAPKVNTYVVAFNFAQTSGNLNCHAYHGRTARRDQCPAVTEQNCDAQTCAVNADCPSGVCNTTTCQPATCYYDTQQLDDLKVALGNIVQQVRGCSFLLTVPMTQPRTPNRLFLYLQSSGGTLTRVDRYVGWDYDTVANGISVFGASCDTIKAGTATPVVVYGCCSGAECGG